MTYDGSYTGPLGTPLKYAFSDIAGDTFTLEADESAVWIEPTGCSIMLDAKNAKAFVRFIKKAAKEHEALKRQARSQRDGT